MRLTNAKILFYCHHPDKLLTTRDSLLKAIYRMPIDTFEEYTTDMAHEIVVNSKYTGQVYKDAFRKIKGTPKVLYPGLHLELYNSNVNLSDERVKVLSSKKRFVVSMNRFERKKNIDLAIHAFAALRDKTPDAFANLRLIVAGNALRNDVKAIQAIHSYCTGGYDTRVRENVEYLTELHSLAQGIGLTSYTLGTKSAAPTETVQVIFLPSFSEAQRTYLLANAVCLLYTPTNEHFGIVPIEAMYAQLPVVAVNTGGPTETVVDGVTGYLRPAEPEAFADAVALLLKDEERRKEMGLRGMKHVKASFSLDSFVRQLEDIIGGLWKVEKPPVWKVVGGAAMGVLGCMVLVCWLLWRAVGTWVFAQSKSKQA
ncbi:Alpha-1,3-mannosyltransferase-like protein [Rhizophlyctis rosea]|nr:Alpha-1,3-mannosyltransferase-like protein [Rhizophlyctis rosea]